MRPASDAMRCLPRVSSALCASPAREVSGRRFREQKAARPVVPLSRRLVRGATRARTKIGGANWRERKNLRIEAETKGLGAPPTRLGHCAVRRLPVWTRIAGCRCCLLEFVSLAATATARARKIARLLRRWRIMAMQQRTPTAAPAEQSQGRQPAWRGAAWLLSLRCGPPLRRASGPLVEAPRY